MNSKTIRTLLLVAFAANLAFLGLILADYYVWQGNYALPLFVAWAIVVMVTVLVGLFAKSSDTFGQRVIERIYMQGTPTPEPLASPVVAATPVPVAVEAPGKDEPFVFRGYTLHSRDVELKNGGQRTIWFFSKGNPKSGKPSPKPEGFHVGVNERTGLPFLKRGVAADGEDLTPTIEVAYRPQCAAITEGDQQCRNSARHDSKYCASHFGYQPPAMAKAQAKRQDTRPRVRGASDTLPSVRKAQA